MWTILVQVFRGPNQKENIQPGFLKPGKEIVRHAWYSTVCQTYNSTGVRGSRNYCEMSRVTEEPFRRQTRRPGSHVRCHQSSRNPRDAGNIATSGMTFLAHRASDVFKPLYVCKSVTKFIIATILIYLPYYYQGGLSG
ncbi:hypothetical protein FKM82_002368 [Ascaphus truei]